MQGFEGEEVSRMRPVMDSHRRVGLPQKKKLKARTLVCKIPKKSAISLYTVAFFTSYRTTIDDTVHYHTI